MSCLAKRTVCFSRMALLHGVSLVRKSCFGNRVAVINMIQVNLSGFVMPYSILRLTRNQLRRGVFGDTVMKTLLFRLYSIST